MRGAGQRAGQQEPRGRGGRKCQHSWLRLEERCTWARKGMQGERMGPQLVCLLWGIGLCYFVCKMVYLRALRGGHDYKKVISVEIQCICIRLSPCLHM